MRKSILTGFTFLFAVALYCQELKTPVSAQKFNNDSNTFRFAIVSDRTGGMRDDVFAKAIEKLNLMQPEFVISVGDLIDGYTKDPNIWTAQWDEFDSLVNRLNMPFYYVPGNHDSSNDLLIKAWHKRHGRDYYHFLYKNVLFIALNTDELKDGGISQKQVDYVKKALDENQNVQWTLIFMHRPLWSYGDAAGYEGIEAALKGRKYTLFSGHHHNYQYQVKNGMDHYVLATTGGGSYMRGPEVGEFDHISWITMKKEGPKVAHLNLDAIYDKNIVPPEDYADIEILRRGNWLDVDPVVSETKAFDSLKTNIRFTNEMERPMTVSGELRPYHGLIFEPYTISVNVNPGADISIPVMVKSKSGLPLDINVINNDTIDFELNAGFERKNRNPVQLSTSKKMLLDWKHDLKSPRSAITIDGNLSDWETEEFIEVKNPQYFDEGWDWKGPNDGEFSFATLADKKQLYIAVKFKDQLTISDTKDLSALQDKFFIHITADREAKNYLKLEFATGNKSKSPLINKSAKALKGLKVAITKNSGGQLLELAIPLKSIQAENSEVIRINIGIMDHDRPENTKPSVLWWRPAWEGEMSYKGSSNFYKAMN
jgi:predicted phosphodiesterase